MLIQGYSFMQQRTKITKGFHKALAYYHKVDYEEKKSFQHSKFQEQIKNNTFYTKQNITEYPISNKNFIKDNYAQIINESEIKSYLYTSGTTGSGLKFPISLEFNDHQLAVFWKFRNLHGLTLNSWCAYIIGQSIFDIDSKKPPFWIASYPSKQLLFSQYHLNENSVELYLNKLISSKIEWLHAYPSVLNNLCNLIKENHLEARVQELNIKVITTSSEKLFDYQKQNIESLLKCPIRELYGLTEGVVNIFECEKGSLHIDESYSYVELLPKEGTNEYKIIGTSYHNKAFPLVRYDTGDTCLLHDSDFSCSCHRKSRIVKEILGRDEDYLILNDGTKIGRLDHIFKNMTEVKEAQIFQEEQGEATFKIVQGEEFTEKSEMKLNKQIRDKLGTSFQYTINYLEKIPRTKRGKLKFVISTINNTTQTEGKTL